MSVTTGSGEAGATNRDTGDLLPLAILAAAPHRLLFFAGASAVLLSMAWWALVLIAARWHGFTMPPSPVPAGWLHAIAMQYQVLAFFVFGFSLTVMPRWAGAPPFTRRHYVPVAGAVFGGYLATLAGLAGMPDAYIVGFWLTLLAWIAGVALLLRPLWHDAGRNYHVVSLWCAIAFGAVGLALFALYLRGGDARLAFASIKWGTFGFLLPVYVTVCHRMIPFFSQAALPGYQARRPGWMLAAFWLLALAHLYLELAHAYAWLWPVDLALAALFAGMSWLWQPLRARPVRLLLVLHLAFLWLPLAFGLYALQGAWFAATGDFVLGRAPVHALAVGFFGSMLVAMVTRVTQGHSGRPLEMGRTAWTCFLAIQVVAVARLVGELADDAPAWHAITAVGWVLAFVPWVVRSLWIYATPRADGKPG